MPPSDRGRDGAARADWPLALLVVVSAGLVHTPILGHYFRSDDFAHLYNLANFGLLHFVLTPYGGHLLVIRNAIFSLHHQLFGLNAQLYFIAVLLTHMLNAYLLFRALRLFTGRATLAAFAAALFGMAPVGEGALGWYSAYCHVLVGTILLWVLCDIARLNRGGASPGPITLVRWYLLLLAASLTFGIGIAIAMVSGPAFWLLLPRATNRRRIGLGFGSLAVLVPILYVSVYLLHGQATWGSHLGWQLESLRPNRWPGLVAPLLALVDYGIASVLFGPLLTSDVRGVLAGPLQGLSLDRAVGLSHLVAVLAAVAGVGALARAPGERRRQILGLVLILVASYGIIVLGRGLMIDGLNASLSWWASRPRYHYVGPALVALILGLTLAPIRVPRILDGWRGGALLGFCVALAVVPYLQSSRRLSDSRGTGPREAHRSALASIRQTIDKHPRGADVYIPNRPFRSGWGIPHSNLFPGWAAIFIISYPENTVEGKRIYFVENNPLLRIHAAQLEGTRISGLLAAPRPEPELAD